MQKITGTKEAFLIMIKEPNVCKKLFVDHSTVSNWKKREPTLDKMEEMLLRYGATCITDKVWQL